MPRQSNWRKLKKQYDSAMEEFRIGESVRFQHYVRPFVYSVLHSTYIKLLSRLRPCHDH